jgi:LacI family transcriptional regulator
LLIPDIEDTIFPPIVRGFEDELARTGYSVILAYTDDDASRRRSVQRGLLARQLDGFAIAGDHVNHDGLDDQSMPVVFINRMGAESDVPSVTSDDGGGARGLVDHLFDLGHTKIAYISGPRSASASLRRLEGYARGLRDHNQEFDPSRVAFAQPFSIAGGVVACRELLDRGADFTAVMGGDDMVAIGCLEVMQIAGICVPDGVSPAGFNDMPLVDVLTPSLTTMRVPYYDMGVEVARLLVGRMTGADDPRIYVELPTHLIARASTAPPPPTVS